MDREIECESGAKKVEKKQSDRIRQNVEQERNQNLEPEIRVRKRNEKVLNEYLTKIEKVEKKYRNRREKVE